MSDKIRIADLPESTTLDANSFMIVERPGVGTGTFKATLRQIQEAITVSAKVEEIDKEVTITIQDITGQSSVSMLIPTAKITDNGDGTSTLVLTDIDGTTQSIIINSLVFDDEPTEGSINIVNSGVVWSSLNSQKEDIQEAINELQQTTNQKFAALQEQLTVLQEDNIQLKDRVTTLETTVSAMQDELDQAQTEISAMKLVTDIALTTEQ